MTGRQPSSPSVRCQPSAPALPMCLAAAAHPPQGRAVPGPSRLWDWRRASGSPAAPRLAASRASSGQEFRIGVGVKGAKERCTPLRRPVSVQLWPRPLVAASQRAHGAARFGKAVVKALKRFHCHPRSQPPAGGGRRRRGKPLPGKLLNAWIPARRTAVPARPMQGRAMLWIPTQCWANGGARQPQRIADKRSAEKSAPDPSLKRPIPRRALSAAAKRHAPSGI